MAVLEFVAPSRMSVAANLTRAERRIGFLGGNPEFVRPALAVVDPQRPEPTQRGRIVSHTALMSRQMRSAKPVDAADCGARFPALCREMRMLGLCAISSIQSRPTLDQQLPRLQEKGSAMFLFVNPPRITSKRRGRSLLEDGSIYYKSVPLVR